MKSKVILVATLVVLSACKAETGTDASSLDACTLLSQSDVEVAIGESVTKTEKGATATGVSFCHWYGDDTKLFTKGITLLVAPTLGKERYEAIKSETKDPIDVADIGDAAFTSSNDGAGVTLYQGNNYLQVTALYSETGIDLNTCKGLASTALKTLTQTTTETSK
jgi:hypothetical protein